MIDKQVPQLPDGFKRCTKCDTVKPLGEFSRGSNFKSGYRSVCKDCERQYRRENRERRSEYIKQYCQENRKKITEYQKQYHQKNPEYQKQYYQKKRKQITNHIRQYRQVNRETIWANTTEYQRLHRQENRERYRVYEANRRARKRALPDTLTPSDWQTALDYFNHTCAVCGRQRGLWHTLAADHWIPLVSPDCPGTIPTNIVPLCHGVGGCNNSKNDKHPETWLKEQFGDKQAKKILQRIGAYFESISIR